MSCLALAAIMCTYKKAKDLAKTVSNGVIYRHIADCNINRVFS